MSKTLYFAAPLLAVLTAGAAQAALNAEAVWADLQNQITSEGMTLEVARKDYANATLTLEELRLKDAQGEALLLVNKLTLVETADGKVVASPLGISLAPTEEGEELKLRHEDLTLTVSEGGVGYDYAMKASLLGIEAKSETDQIALDGSDAKARQSNLATLMDVEGSYIRQTEAVDVTLKTKSIYTASAMESDQEGALSMKTSEMSDVALAGKITLPPGGLALHDLGDDKVFVKAVQDGLALSLDVSQGVVVTKSEDNNMFMPMTISAEMAPGMTALRFDKTAFSLSGEGGAVKSSFLTPMLGDAPTDISLGGYGFGLTMPMIAVDQPGDFGLKLSLKDLSIGEPIWAFFDPEKKLGREPAQLQIDLSGKARADMLDMASDEIKGEGLFAYDPERDGEAQTDSSESDLPELKSLDINTLLVQIAGASLTGTGAFTFENAGGNSLDSMPVPVGKADLMVEGVNRLIDALAGLGFLSEDDVAGARMMLMMFGAPVEGRADALRSEVEFKADGQIFVNGQRMQ